MNQILKYIVKYPFDCKLFKADRSASASFEHRKNTKARVVIRSYDFGVDSPWKWIVKINACPAAESDAGFPANSKTISFLYVFDIRMPYTEELERNISNFHYYIKNNNFIQNYKFLDTVNCTFK